VQGTYQASFYAEGIRIIHDHSPITVYLYSSLRSITPFEAATASPSDSHTVCTTDSSLRAAVELASIQLTTEYVWLINPPLEAQPQTQPPR
jgi:hypothetical protein